MKLLNVLVFFVLFNVASCGDLRPGPVDRTFGTSPAPTPVCVAASAPASPVIETFFSPKGGCTDQVVARIGKASSIRLLAYSFTSKPIISALIATHQRTKDVEIILDRSDVGSSGAEELIAAGVPVWFDEKHTIAHQKVIIFDQAVVEQGSFNFTQQAERQNSENCNFISWKPSAMQYLENWEHHKSHSVLPADADPPKKRARFNKATD